MKESADRPCLMFVLGMTPTKIGGIEKFLRLLTIQLSDSGWQTVLAFDGDITEEFREYFRLPFVSIEIIRHQEGLGFRASGLWTALRKHKPQVFVYAFHSVMRAFPWIARIAGCRRIFFNDHSSRAQGMVPSPLSLPKRIVGRVLTAPLTAIISVADFTRRSQTAFGISSTENIVVTNGIEMQPLNPEKGGKFRDKYQIPRDAVVIGQVCWMVRVKGVEVMLRAAQLVLQQHPATRFLLVGGGEKLPEYRALAAEMRLEESVCFTDIVSDPIGAGVLDALDVYAQPSRWQEACPLAVLEAMSKKLPVVASNTGGLPELVDDGKTGILVPVEDHEKLAAALNLLIENVPLRQRMGEAGYESVLASHRIEEMSRKYIQLFVGNKVS